MSAEFSATSDRDPTPPIPFGPVVPPPIASLNRVLALTSLNANGTGSARIANLGYANVTTNVNLSAQNAVSNQQAHSQLNLSVAGRSVNQVSNLGPLTARSSVDVFSDNELAETLAGLQSVLTGFASGGGRGWHLPRSLRGLLRLVREILAVVAAIERQNAQLRGTGTESDPYNTVGSQLLFVTAPVSLVFVGVPTDDLRLRQDITGTPPV